MLLIGLTGGIGSGKSTVSAGLSAYGAVIIDADAIARELQEPGTSVFVKMVERFGEQIIGSDGRLDRQAVADIVFADATLLNDLNAIVHPAVGSEIEKRLAREMTTNNVVILDVPLLVEAMLGLSTAGSKAGRMTPWGELAGIIVVDTDPEIAVSRLVAHRGFTEADARARMARQSGRDERLSMADFVIPNNGTREDLDIWIERLWGWISSLRSSETS